MPLDDANWNKTKPDVFSLAGLTAWLKTQDPATEYDYQDCGGECLVGRYLVSTTGKSWKAHGYPHWGKFSSHHPEFNAVAVDWPWTYAAALERAQALEQAARTP